MTIFNKYYETRNIINSHFLVLVVASGYFLSLIVILISQSNSLIIDFLLAIASALALPFIITRYFEKKIIISLVFLLLLLAIYAISSFINPSFGALKHTISLALCIVTFRFAHIYSRYILSSRFLAALASLFLLVAAALSLLAFDEKNKLNGVVAYAAIILSMYSTGKRRYSAQVLSVFFIIGMSLLANHRALAATSSVLLVYLLFQNTVRYHRLIFLIMAAICSAAIMVTTLTMLDAGPIPLYEVNAFVIEATGRPATSGREFIWQSILDLVSTNPTFGLGAGALFSQFYDTTLSAHSIFMQILLQVGYVGLCVFIVSLLSLCAPLTAEEGQFWTNDHIFASLVILFIILHSSTEVFLTQNALLIGVPSWLAAGLSLGILRGHDQPF